MPVSKMVRKKKDKFQNEYDTINRKKDEIDFLKDNS